MRGDLERLLDIQEAVNKIEKHFNKGSFIRDEILQAAIVRYLEIIGEASRGLTEETKSQSPETEWSRIVSFRNFVVHNYFDIDGDIVCKVIEEDIPKLKVQIEKILENYKTN